MILVHVGRMLQLNMYNLSRFSIQARRHAKLCRWRPINTSEIYIGFRNIYKEENQGVNQFEETGGVNAY